LKITLDSIISGFKSVTKLIANFDLIESELNDKVLYRDNPDREPNQMNTELDMNSKGLKNLPSPTNDNDAARWIDVKNGVVTTDVILPTLSGNTDRALSTDSASLVFKDGDDLSFTNTAAGATRRTLGAKISESVSVEDFGALGNGSIDDLAAINAALATNKSVEFKADTTYRVSALPSFTNAKVVGNGAVLTVDDGDYANVTAKTFDKIAGKLTIDSSGFTNAATVTGVTSSSGSSGDWTVELSCSDTTLAAVVGSYVVFPYSLGFESFAGYHEVLATVGNTSVTVKITSQSSTNPFTPVVFGSPKTISKANAEIDFDGGGFLIEDGTLVLGDMGIRTDAPVSSVAGVYVQNKATLEITGTLCISGFDWGLRAKTSSQIISTTGTYVVSDCSSTGLLLQNNCFLYLDGTNHVVTGSTQGYNLQYSKSISEETKALHCDGGVAVTGGEANLGTYLYKNEQFDGSTALAAFAHANVTAGTLSSIIGATTGVYAFTNGQITYGGYITFCTTAVRGARHAELDLNGATLSSNTINYNISQGCILTNSTGGVETSNVEYLTLTDGASVPTTAVGKTYLYVDSADGDLKAKFGNGTVVDLITGAAVVGGGSGQGTFYLNNSNTYTVADGVGYIQNESSGTCTLTLPTPADNTGRVITLKNNVNQTVQSATSVVQRDSSTSSTSLINPGFQYRAGAWMNLACDGTTWYIMGWGDGVVN